MLCSSDFERGVVHVRACTFVCSFALPLALFAGALLALSPNQAVAAVPDTVLLTQTLQFPTGFMPSIKDYGAVGDGVTDDTAAIKRALADGRLDASGNPLHPPAEFNGRSKALYFPPGTYLVSDTLKWVGCCVTLQGSGPTATTIRLKPNTPAFGNATSPKPVIQTENGNESFRQNIWDIAVVVGSGNPGAIGIDHITNNVGAMKNVLIKSEDGQGVAGLDMTRNWPGPNLYKRVQIEGFDVGIRVNYIEYSQTYEYILLKNQRVAGIHNDGAVMTMRKLYSVNSVPVIDNDRYGSGLLTIVDGEFTGGDPARSAIKTTRRGAGETYLRNVRSSGYASLLAIDGVAQAGMSRGEWYSGVKDAGLYNLFPVANDALMFRLPIAETPETHDNDMNNWAMSTCNGYAGCTTLNGIQTAFATGKPNIALVFGNKIQFSPITITVPASVKRIAGFTGAINEGGIEWKIADDSTEPLVIDGISYGTRIWHTGKRTVVIKSGFYGYRSDPGAGDVIVEDVGIEGFTIRSGQRFWAHHINNENHTGTKLTNDGGRVWIFGMKTEDRFTVIDTKNGGVTEYIGGLTYPAANTLPGETIFTVDETSRLAALHSAIVYTTRFYDNAVTETKGGQTKTLTSAASSGLTRLYRSPPIGCSADVDQSSAVTAMKDALTLLRYANGVRGDALIANTSLSNAVAAEQWIDTRLAELDVDNDSTFDVRDALVLQRYALGFSGDALIQGINFSGPNNTTALIAPRIARMFCQ
jgi:Pectate lyase superfamily protein